VFQGIHVWPHAALRQMKQEGLIARYYEEGLRSKNVRPLEAELPSLPVLPAASRP
jgi:hypothetical protein